jgi:hypothetical protein
VNATRILWVGIEGVFARPRRIIGDDGQDLFAQAQNDKSDRFDEIALAFFRGERDHKSA